jgi:predicted ester cyclase
MSIEANKALARAAIAVWTTGDDGRAGEVFAADYVMHQHHDPEGAGDLDLAQMAAFAREFRETFPDLRDTIDIQLAEGDLVATRFTSAGTQSGAYHGIAATGRRMAWTGTVIDRIADGRIRESWGNWDMLGMLQQMGADLRQP